MIFRVYGHLTCPTTYRLFKKLLEADLLSKVSLVDVGLDPLKSFIEKIVSVPAVIFRDKLIYSGVFSVSEAVKTISSEELPRIDVFDYESASEKIMYGVLDSSLLALYIFVHDDLEKIFMLREFVEAVSRHVFYINRSDESYDNLRKRFLGFIESSKQYFEDLLIQTIANLLVREYIQSRINTSSREIIEKEIPSTYLDKAFLTQHILGRASFGRIGLLMGYPRISSRFSERIDLLRSYLESNWSKLFDKIYRDQLNILGDKEYVDRYLAMVSSI